MSRSDDDRSLSHASGVAKNYGTVTTRVNPGYVEHAVQKTDTLQGIALKYGTTVEIIRRVNKLHSATGMLHLMDVILIPSQDSLLSSGSYRGSPDHFQRISPSPEHNPQEDGKVRSIDEILKSADHQLKISHTFVQNLAKKYPQKQEGYNKLETNDAQSIDQATLSRAHHKNLLSSKEDEQRDQKEQLENDLFEL